MMYLLQDVRAHNFNYIQKQQRYFPAGIYLFKVKNVDIIKMSENCLKLTLLTLNK